MMMKKLIKKTCILLSVFLLLKNVNAVDNWDNIAFSIKPLKQKITYGEPVILQAELTNLGNQAVWFANSELDVGFDTVGVSIINKAGISQVYRTWYVEEPGDAGFSIPAKKKRVFHLNLHWNAATDSYIFDTSGQFNIIVKVFNFSGGNHLTATSKIDVIATLERLDNQMSGLLLRRDIAGVLAGVSQPDGDTLALFEQAIEQKNLMSPYFSEALGRYYLTSDLTRTEAVNRSNHYFKKALDGMSIDFPLRLQAMKGLYQSSLAEQDVKSAEIALQKLEQINPDDIKLFNMRNNLQQERIFQSIKEE